MQKLLVEQRAGEWVAILTNGTIVARGADRDAVDGEAREYARRHGTPDDPISVQLDQHDGTSLIEEVDPPPPLPDGIG
jgi:hypothetical protein